MCLPPTFDGNVLNWKYFWDQFRVAVYDRTDVAPAEKMVYLENALKDNNRWTMAIVIRSYYPLTIPW